MTATLICTLDEFWSYLDPKIRNYVQSFTKSAKKNKGLICEECNKKVTELESAHKHGRSRRSIVKIILSDYETEHEKYTIPNLQKFFERIKKEYFPFEDNFRFMCKPCHDEYDKSEKKSSIITSSDSNSIGNYTSDSTVTYNTDYQKVFANLLSVNPNLRECLRELFLKFPETLITTTKLRETYRQCHPNESLTQCQKVPNYMWELANYEGFLVNEGRSVYRLNNKT